MKLTRITLAALAIALVPCGARGQQQEQHPPLWSPRVAGAPASAIGGAGGSGAGRKARYPAGCRT